MSNKRKNGSNIHDAPKSKRARPGTSIPVDESYTHGRVDPVYGQHGAFPGLDANDDEDELFYGPASDGLQYLRMVRREAQSVPNLLKAPTPQTHQRPASRQPAEEPKDGEWEEEEDSGDPNREQFCYEDGNYWRVAPVPAVHGGGAEQDSDALMYDDYEEPPEEDIDPQEAYYESLMTRFKAFRTQLASPPATPSSTNPLSLPGYNATYAEWESAILASAPSMLALSQMEQRHVLQAIARVEDLLTKKHLLDGRKGRNLGAWCWGLLGRCKGVDEMISEEVGVVRGLARRAVGVLRRWGSREGTRTEMGVETNGVVVSAQGDAGEDAAEDGEAGSICESELEEGEELGDEDGEIVEDVINLTSGTRAEANLRPTELSLPSVPEPFARDGARDQAAVRLELARQGLLERLSSPTPANESTSKPPSDEAPLPSPSKSRPVPQEPDLDEGEIPAGSDPESEKDEPSSSVTGQGVRRPVADPQTAALATLDMIITVVGELWGQRDLLVHREVWGERD